MNTETLSKQPARFVRIRILETERGDEPCIDELEVYADERNVALASAGGIATASSEYPDISIHKIAHLNDGLVGNSHSWISNEKGKGWAQIELAHMYKIDTICWGRDRDRKYTDRLPSKYRIELSSDGKEWVTVASDQDRLLRFSVPPNAELKKQLAEHRAKLETLQRELDQLKSSTTFYIGKFKSPDKVHLLKRGDPMQKLEEVKPAAIAVIKAPLKFSLWPSEANRRLALADWITHPDNPLPARVMVNRIWHYHFGTGIVNTPSDFGFNGGRPSHPELLDWLAAEFLKNGGRLKPLHRLIVLSATYRQSSKITTEQHTLTMQKDADNRLLWHFPRRRLEAEIVRDTILSITGSLDTTMGGPGYDLWKYSNYVLVFEPRDPLPKDAYRRMVYQFKPRTQQDMTFGAFDCPDGTMAIPRRNLSTTALQALNLLNSSFMLEQSQALAQRLEKDAGPDAKKQIEHGFLLAFSRPPTDKEMQASLQVVKQSGLATFCRALLNTNELVFID